MFASTPTHINGAPEILHATQQSAPRSWNNLRRWIIQKSQNNGGQRGEEQFRTRAMNTTDHHTTHNNVPEQPRRGHPAAATVLKHTAIFLAFSIPIVILVLVIKVPTWYAFEAEHWISKSFTHCNFNGEFTPLDKPTLGLWDPSGFFYINVSWGKMAFSTAKFIDIAWDIVVGRGGQALLALTTFKVSSQYLALTMREAPVSYNTFESLAFVPPTIVRTIRLAGDVLTHRGWRARLIIVWIILSSLFVLSFSSWITAMSGYSSNIEAVMPNYDNDSVMWSNFAVVQFAINDAERIGHPGPLFITMGETCAAEGFVDDDDDNNSGNYDETSSTEKHRRRDNDDRGESERVDGSENIPWEYVPANCTSFWRTVQYVSTYGLGGNNETETTITLNGTIHNISAPALDIITSYSSDALSTLTTYLTTFSESSPPARGLPGSVSQLTDNTFWVYDDETYPFSYVRDNAACQYSKWHNWGFSFLFLFIASLLLALWSVGTYALWLYVHLHTPCDQSPSQNSVPGLYRSSFTLVEAMKRDVGSGAVTSAMKERDVRDLVRRRQGRVIHGVGNIDDHSPRTLSEPEKHVSAAPSTSSPTTQYTSRGWNGFRTWLSPSSRTRSRHMVGLETPANSVFSHSNSTYSSASQHPILQSPATPGRTMTMTSRISSLASPFADAPPEFGFSAAEESSILDTSQIVSAGAGPVSGIPDSGPTTGRMRPKLSISRAIRSSTLSSAPHSATLLSAASLTGKWATSPIPITPSEDSMSTISPVREHEEGRREGDDDAVRWQNDLGDD